MRLALAFVVCFAASSGALAQDKPATPQKSDSASGGATAPTPSFGRDAEASRALFERLDKNRDGYLTGSELTSPDALSANWISVDRDADGRVARSEFTSIESGGVAATRRP
jgi:hypothetical protein